MTKADPLVVLTYPGHFLLTALTIQSFLKHNTTDSVYVIVDDLSRFCWPEYVNDCKKLYSNATILLVSNLAPASLFVDDPWIRQQIVKLHLDQLLPFDRWMFSDGDVEYFFPVPVDSIPFTIMRGSSAQHQHNAYVAELLGIDSPGIYTEHPDMDWEPGTYRHQVCVSNPPFRTMYAGVLTQLRAHVEQLHGCTMSHLHLTKSSIASEWELIANFQLLVLKHPVDIVYYPTISMTDPCPTKTDQPDYCATCYNVDVDFDKQWWRSKGIDISDQLWSTLSNIVR
jgi:hypothetical protein